jgi:hypothetical protein
LGDRVRKTAACPALTRDRWKGRAKSRRQAVGRLGAVSLRDAPG